MTSVRPLRPEPPPEPPALHARAMDNLAFIRNTMEAAAAFTAVPGWGMVAVGVLGLGTAIISAMQPEIERALQVWLGAAVFAVAISVWALIRKSRAARMPLLSGPGRKFMLSFAPPIFVGAILTVVLYRAELFTAIPGVWLLLYGTAVVVGGAFSVQIVPVMGLCFMLAGVLGLFAPAAWQPWIMGGAFGGLHIAFGIPIARRHGG